MEWLRLEWLRLEWFGLEWFGLEWFGLEWFGLEWFGLEWFGLEWFGLEWFGLEWLRLEWPGLDDMGWSQHMSSFVSEMLLTNDNTVVGVLVRRLCNLESWTAFFKHGCWSKLLPTSTSSTSSWVPTSTSSWVPTSSSTSSATSLPTVACVKNMIVLAWIKSLAAETRLANDIAWNGLVNSKVTTFEFTARIKFKIC